MTASSNQAPDGEGQEPKFTLHRRLELHPGGFWGHRKNMNCLENIRETVAAWPQVSVGPHRFGGSEFRFAKAEVGHVHRGGVVDIPFPRPIRDFLLAEGLAEEHRWVPNSGWITFEVHNEEHLERAVWLLRLSYLRYALKTAPHPREQLEQESQALRLGPELQSLLEAFIPTTPRSA